MLTLTRENNMIKTKKTIDITSYLDKNLSINELMKNSLFYTFLFGLCAHMYAFTNLTVSHDSLGALHAFDAWKVSLGRFGVVIYKFFTGSFITLPWSAGIISLTFVAISVFLICRIFCLTKRWNVLAVSGILITNMTVTSLIATYIHDLGADMLALLFSVLAAYIWSRIKQYSESPPKHIFPSDNKRNIIIPYLLFIFCIISSLSLYQSYLSVTLVIILLILLRDLCEGKSFIKVLKTGSLTSIYILAACLAYLVLALLACKVIGEPLNTSSYNSLSNITNASIPVTSRLFNTFYNVIKALFIKPQSLFRYPAVIFAHILLIGISIRSGIKKWLNLKIKEKILATGMILSIPFAMNISGFLNGFSHDLMFYAIYLFYIPVIILNSKESVMEAAYKRKKRIFTILGMIGIIIFSNIQSANAFYVKKDTERQATLSLVTQALSVISQQNGYQYGKTPIAFLGNPLDQEEIRLSEGNMEDLPGFDLRAQVTYYDTWNAYMKNILNYKVNICTLEEIEALEMKKEV